jgi:hypothetical protein
MRRTPPEDTLEVTPEDTPEDTSGEHPGGRLGGQPRRTPRRTPTEGNPGGLQRGHPPHLIYLSKTLFTSTVEAPKSSS